MLSILFQPEDGPGRGLLGDDCEILLNLRLKLHSLQVDPGPRVLGLGQTEYLTNKGDKSTINNVQNECLGLIINS